MQKQLLTAFLTLASLGMLSPVGAQVLDGLDGDVSLLDIHSELQKLPDDERAYPIFAVTDGAGKLKKLCHGADLTNCLNFFEVIRSDLKEMKAK